MIYLPSLLWDVFVTQWHFVLVMLSMFCPLTLRFLKDVSFYFSRSSKRKRDFMAIQQVVRVVPHKMVKLSQTRWLSREKVISTVIEQYDALILYFEKECKTDKVDGARKIFDTLTNCGTKHMLLFLQYILQKVNAINIESQSEHFRLHQLYTMITSEYKNILNCFIKKFYLQKYCQKLIHKI